MIEWFVVLTFLLVDEFCDKLGRLLASSALLCDVNIYLVSANLCYVKFCDVVSQNDSFDEAYDFGCVSCDHRLLVYYMVSSPLVQH